MIAALEILGGVVLLYLGGEALVRGASRVALRFGLSPLVIGLTVVAFGTSAPELAASLAAVYEGSEGIALGNVLGSNIANIGLILGLAALMRPLTAESVVLKREIPFMIFVSVLLVPMALDGAFQRFDGGLMLFFFVGYLFVLLRKGEAPPDVDEELGDLDPSEISVNREVVLIAVGIAMLVLGSDLLVQGAVEIARYFSVSEQVIGLTLVAFGTSLPELATSVVAARKGEGDIVLGNVIGSNIFNVLLVLGTTSLLLEIPAALAAIQRDLITGLVFSVVVVIFLLVPKPLHLGRGEGSVLLAAYIGYIFWVFWS
ncbi:MAG: calcium/sodium antiporter [Acidobacteriota bacterium]